MGNRGRHEGFFDAFKPAFQSGQTSEGTWRYLEKFGRFTGNGEVEAELELPEGTVVISNEEHPEVEEFELELIGPTGEAIELKRFSRNNNDMDRGAHNLFRISEGKLATAGLHRLRVKGPDPQEPLLILVGEDLSVADAILGTAPGGKLFKRLRGD